MNARTFLHYYPLIIIDLQPGSLSDFKILYFPLMNLLGNLIWLLFGGLAAALGYIVGGFVLCLTIVGIPFGIQCFKIASLELWPFGRQIVSTGSSMGCLSVICNIIWLICGGLYTALVHLLFALLLTITIIGIPFARQHLKLMELSLMPFGKQII
jgi:uncharacterized membrane protein YccF (DUF307 family)